MVRQGPVVNGWNGGRKRRTMRGGYDYGPYITDGGRKRRTMRGGFALDGLGGRKRRTMRGGNRIWSKIPS